MQYNMPLFLIVVSIFVVYMVVIVIIDVVSDARKGQERPDQDDFDVKYY
ncbi:hypothetical protein [Paenibacillus sp. MAEPY2]|nr:hypothetical protein [Paenibacillus sp. MAEPY2]